MLDWCVVTERKRNALFRPASVCGGSWGDHRVGRGAELGLEYAPTTALRLLPQGGTTLQPPDDFVGSRFAGRDLLHHRNVRIDIFSGERSAVASRNNQTERKAARLLPSGSG